MRVRVGWCAVHANQPTLPEQFEGALQLGPGMRVAQPLSDLDAPAVGFAGLLDPPESFQRLSEVIVRGLVVRVAGQQVLEERNCFGGMAAPEMFLRQTVLNKRVIRVGGQELLERLQP